MNNRNVLAVFQAACKNHIGGITAMATVMGVSPVILANKLNPNHEQNHLSLLDACEIIEITQDKRLLNALAMLADYCVVPLPETQYCVMDVVRHFTKVMGACSGVGKEVMMATSSESDMGETLSKKERKAIKQELELLIQAAVGLHRSL
ncbi:MAG: phage regulatory CII family protein [Neisseria sp.]|nr:phage regulatory CII family protein [Neisseria sp.]